MEDLTIGDAVVFFDEVRQSHDALITCIHSQGGTMDEFHEINGCYPSINLVLVSSDERKTDPNGRQIERHSSVVHRGSMPLPDPAMCWEPKA